MSFSFTTSRRIRFGDGVAAELPDLCAARGRCALLVTGSRPERHAERRAAIEEAGLEVHTFAVRGEPTTEIAEAATALGREVGADVVVGLGGGSVLDTGKAVAALLTNGGAPLDYLEVIGAGRKIERPSAPYIAVPTTAGTGAEATKNAVLKSEAHAVKVSLRSDFMLPDVALVDPELTFSAPPAVTASTGLDALTQVIEPFVSRLHNPLTDALCREAIPRAARSLRRAYERGDDADARRDMALVSLIGGIALANAKLGAVHGFAGPLGGMAPGPHGAICARLLPLVLEANVRALRERDEGSRLRARFDELGPMLTGRPDAVARDAVTWVEETAAALSVPGLSEYGVQASMLEEAVEKAQRSSSMKGNPIELTREELGDIVARAL